MEQLIFFLVIAVISIVSNIIQNKKKRAEEQRELEQQGWPAPRTESPGPTEEWQDLLKRVLQPEPHRTPPPLPRRSEDYRPLTPILVPEADEYSQTASETALDRMARARAEAERVRRDAESKKHEAQHRFWIRRTPSIEPAPASARFVERLKRDPRTVREAVIASILLGPPPGLVPHSVTPNQPQSPFA